MSTMKNPIAHTTHHHCGFRDVDPFGHMNMANYYAYFVDHRFAALRDRFALTVKAIKELPIGFFTVKSEIEYKRQVRCDESFSITSQVIRADERQCDVECVLTLANGAVASRCTMTIVCVDMATGRGTPWPQGFMDRFYQ